MSITALTSVSAPLFYLSVIYPMKMFSNPKRQLERKKTHLDVLHVVNKLIRRLMPMLILTLLLMLQKLILSLANEAVC